MNKLTEVRGGVVEHQLPPPRPGLHIIILKKILWPAGPPLLARRGNWRNSQRNPQKKELFRLEELQIIYKDEIKLLKL